LRVSDMEAYQSFFLEAAGKCYAGDLPKTTIAELPKSKVYRYEKRNLLYLDVYYTNGESSGGQTTIFWDSVPVWLMQYHGWCKDDDKRTLSFLKEALKSTYERGIWNFGRGPDAYTSQEFPHLRYVIDEHDSGGFETFSGMESVRDYTRRPSDLIFWHRFHGMLLAPE